MKIDTLIHPKWILPIIPRHTILTGQSIALDQGKIIEIAPTSQIKKKYAATQQHHLDQHVVMPGLVNCHAHTPMVLLRGLSDDQALMDWLNNNIWPAEQALVDHGFIEDGMLLGMAEMLKNGITCFSEHYFYPEVAAKSVQDFGMRAIIGLWLGNIQTISSANTKECFDHATAILQSHQPDAMPLVNFCWAPHSPYLLDDQDLATLHELNQSFKLPVHMHVHESPDEIKHNLKHYQKRPFQRLKENGLLNNQFIGVHLTQINQQDLDVLSGTGISVVNCPDANLKLASGFCHTKALLDIGLNLTVGTDGAASNNDLDLLSEVRLASFLAKNLSGDPTILDAFETLELATINGAKAYGLADKIGSVEVGKDADLIAINMNHLNTYPQHHIISQLAYAANSRQVQEAWVMGQHLLSKGQTTQVDEQDLLQIADKWQQKTKDYA